MMILILIATSTCGLCIWISKIKPSIKKINLFAVFLSTIIPFIIPGIILISLIMDDRKGLHTLLAIVLFPVLFIILFIISLATSFVWQLRLLRKRNRDTDEMNRQLWLCDKLLIRLRSEGENQQTALQECVKNLILFLSLRQKHFGIESVADQNILLSYLNQNDTANIQTKLKEYKDWVSQELYE